MPDRSKEMTQTKRDTLAVGWGLGVGGCTWGWQPDSIELGFVSKPQLKPRKRKKVGEAMVRKWAEAPDNNNNNKKKKNTAYAQAVLEI
jgi:hypothetical protein